MGSQRATPHHRYRRTASYWFLPFGSYANSLPQRTVGKSLLILRVKCHFSPCGLDHFANLVQMFHFSPVSSKRFHHFHFSPLS
ncbi:hypothetical protein Hanom_Chr09g00836061 [Helianthus anomalus]